MSNQTIYTELCSSYRAIDEVRTKLLGFLLLASSAILLFLIDPEKVPKVKPLLPPIGMFGSFVTLGLFFFEIYGIRKCTWLVVVVAHLESELGSKHGQFSDRPSGILGVINEPLAAGVIYPAVLAAWTFFALHYGCWVNASDWAAGVFAAGVFVSLVFIAWLSCVDTPRLKAKLTKETAIPVKEATPCV
jgi:hypothetical protein